MYSALFVFPNTTEHIFPCLVIIRFIIYNNYRFRTTYFMDTDNITTLNDVRILLDGLDTIQSVASQRLSQDDDPNPLRIPSAPQVSVVSTTTGTKSHIGFKALYMQCLDFTAYSAVETPILMVTLVGRCNVLTHVASHKMYRPYL